MLAETAQMAVELNLKGNFNQNIAQAGRHLDTFNANVNKTAYKVGQDLGRGINKAAHNIERLAIAGATLAATGGAAAVKWAGDFEAGMRTINSVALTTNDVLQKAGEGLRTTFRETGASMEDLQSAEYDLVSAGIKLKDAQEGVNTAVHLGIGALGTTSEAVDVLTTAINSYNLKAADGTVKTGAFARVADELAQAVADGKVKLSEIAASYAQVAPVAAAAGVKTGEIAAALGFLTAKGVPAAEVMTQMNRALVELQKPKPELQKVLDSLGTTGTALIKKEGLGGALETIRERAAKLKIPFIDLFGRIDAFKFALQTTGPNAAGFAAELDRIAHSAGMTNKQFDERAQGFNYQLGVLKANVQDAGITIGTALLPKLTEMAQKVSDFLRSHQDDIKHFGDELAAGFSKAADFIMSIDWASVGGAIKGLANFGRGLADAFMSLPGPAKELLLGLYGLNKLSGGAVVNIGVDLLKGAFFQRGSPGNPMWVASVNGGLGGPGGPGGGLLDTFLTKVALLVPPLLLAVDTLNKFNNAADPNKTNADFYGTPAPPGLANLFGLLPSGPKLLPAGGSASPVKVQIVASPGNANDREDRGWTQKEHNHLYKALRQATEEDHRHNRVYKELGYDPLGPRALKLAAEQKAALDRIRERAESNAITTKNAITDVRDESARAALAAGGDAQRIQNATSTGSSQIVTAIQRNRPILTVNITGVKANVTSTYSQGDMGGGPSGKYQPGENQ